MKKPIIKNILSYFSEILLESTFSEYNEILEVYLSKGRYQLCSAGAIYSFEDKYINFYETFRALNWKKLEIEKVLLMGLGLASIPQMLEKKFRKNFEYHAVEIDSEIIYLADKYILSDLKSPISIYEMDAEIFVEISEEKFDMIIIDIFDNNTVPEKFESPDFLEQTIDLLSEGGILLYNRLNQDNKTYNETKLYFDEVFSKIFPSSKKLFIKNNIILSNRSDIFVE